MVYDELVLVSHARHKVVMIPMGQMWTFLYGFERVDWCWTVVVVSTKQVACRWQWLVQRLLAAGRLFKFELAVFGTANDFRAGVSRGGEKFDMVVGDLKTSA